MTVPTLILSIIAILVVGFILLCIIAVIYNTKDLEKENETLKKELQKLRSRKLKSEYKKVKGVNNGK